MTPTNDALAAAATAGRVLSPRPPERTQAPDADDSELARRLALVEADNQALTQRLNAFEQRLRKLERSRAAQPSG